MIWNQVYNFRILNAFIREAERRNTSTYIKIDSGMHRLGFLPEQVKELTQTLKGQKGLKVQTFFSHLSASESWLFDEFTHQQMDTFKHVTEEIEKALPYKVYKHILNSAGIERFPEVHWDMCRLGIGLYGVSASGLPGLKNACTLKTTILQIKEVSANETVGYGRKEKLHLTRIATIRFGYADGLTEFGNRKVMINGHYAPIVGNVCMDLYG